MKALANIIISFFAYCLAQFVGSSSHPTMPLHSMDMYATIFAWIHRKKHTPRINKTVQNRLCVSVSFLFILSYIHFSLSVCLNIQGSFRVDSCFPLKIVNNLIDVFMHFRIFGAFALTLRIERKRNCFNLFVRIRAQ